MLYEVITREMCAALAGMPGLALQGEDRQTRYKLSYTAPADTDAAALADAIETVITSYSIHYTKLYEACRCRW